MRAGRDLVVCANVQNSKKGRSLRDTLGAQFLFVLAIRPLSGPANGDGVKAGLNTENLSSVSVVK